MDLIRLSTIAEIMLRDETLELDMDHVLVATDWYLQQLVTDLHYNESLQDRKGAETLVLFLKRAVGEIEELLARPP